MHSFTPHLEIDFNVSGFLGLFLFIYLGKKIHLVLVRNEPVGGS